MSNAPILRHAKPDPDRAPARPWRRVLLAVLSALLPLATAVATILLYLYGPPVWKLYIGYVLERLREPLVLFFLVLTVVTLLVAVLLRYRHRPELLALCFALSALVHLLTIAFFSLWILEHRVVELADARGRHEISVGLPSFSEKAVGQSLREQLLDVEVEDERDLQARGPTVQPRDFRPERAAAKLPEDDRTMPEATPVEPAPAPAPRQPVDETPSRVDTPQPNRDLTKIARADQADTPAEEQAAERRDARAIEIAQAADAFRPDELSPDRPAAEAPEAARPHERTAMDVDRVEPEVRTDEGRIQRRATRQSMDMLPVDVEAPRAEHPVEQPAPDRTLPRRDVAAGRRQPQDTADAPAARRRVEAAPAVTRRAAATPAERLPERELPAVEVETAVRPPADRAPSPAPAPDATAAARNVARIATPAEPARPEARAAENIRTERQQPGQPLVERQPVAREAPAPAPETAPGPRQPVDIEQDAAPRPPERQEVADRVRAPAAQPARAAAEPAVSRTVATLMAAARGEPAPSAPALAGRGSVAAARRTTRPREAAPAVRTGAPQTAPEGRPAPEGASLADHTLPRPAAPPTPTPVQRPGTTVRQLTAREEVTIVDVGGRRMLVSAPAADAAAPAAPALTARALATTPDSARGWQPADPVRDDRARATPRMVQVAGREARSSLAAEGRLGPAAQRASSPAAAESLPRSAAVRGATAPALGVPGTMQPIARSDTGAVTRAAHALPVQEVAAQRRRTAASEAAPPTVARAAAPSESAAPSIDRRPARHAVAALDAPDHGVRPAAARPDDDTLRGRARRPPAQPPIDIASGAATAIAPVTETAPSAAAPAPRADRRDLPAAHRRAAQTAGAEPSPAPRRGPAEPETAVQAPAATEAKPTVALTRFGRYEAATASVRDDPARHAQGTAPALGRAPVRGRARTVRVQPAEPAAESAAAIAERSGEAAFDVARAGRAPDHAGSSAGYIAPPPRATFLDGGPDSGSSGPGGRAAPRAEFAVPDRAPERLRPAEEDGPSTRATLAGADVEASVPLPVGAAALAAEGAADDAARQTGAPRAGTLRVDRARSRGTLPGAPAPSRPHTEPAPDIAPRRPRHMVIDDAAPAEARVRVRETLAERGAGPDVAAGFAAEMAALRAMPSKKAIYQLRAPDKRRAYIDELGGSRETEDAVEAALDWLAGAQSDDGRWDVDGLRGVRRTGGAGNQENGDVGVTGLSLLAYLGAGYTHRQGKHAEAVRQGLDWLVAGMGADGDLRRGGQMYDQAMATAALCETLSLTGDTAYEPAARKAVDFILAAQNPGLAWRYEPREENDTSVTGWQILALKSAEVAGIAVPAQHYRWTEQWLNKVRRGEKGGLYAYRDGHTVTPVMTAEGWFCQLFMDEGSRSRGQEESVAYLMEHLPVWAPEIPGAVHFYYWYYSTLALHLSGSDAFARWNDAITAALLRGRVTEGPAAGSWDPVSHLGARGGRVYTTATAALCLEVYYRYLPFYKLR